MEPTDREQLKNNERELRVSDTGLQELLQGRDREMYEFRQMKREGTDAAESIKEPEENQQGSDAERKRVEADLRG